MSRHPDKRWKSRRKCDGPETEDIGVRGQRPSALAEQEVAEGGCPRGKPSWRQRLVDLKNYPLPIYDGDLEAGEGLPANARRLRELMLDHDGFLIASPEYNGSIAPLLKNVIDWTSRPVDGQDGLAPTRTR
jgi:NAD(P)H-dependent FMN reductase